MLILVVLTLIGVSATHLSRVELQIAGNDRLHKETFYQADGGTEVGANLLEENISCPVGFSGSAPKTIGSVTITSDLAFWKNETDPEKLPTPIPYPSDTQRHIRYNADIAVAANDALPHTNLHFFGNSSLSTGNAVQMIAGYEGTGYSSATGGGQLVTNVDSQHRGLSNSLSNIRSLWRHIIGHEGTCIY
jgi:hypothetical protein